MTSKGLAAVWAACAVLLASCGGGSGGGGSGSGAGTVSAKASAESDTAQQQAKAQNDKENGNSVRLRVLSSAPEYVSGGDARIEVRAAPGLRDKLELWLNGAASTWRSPKPRPASKAWSPA